MKAAEGKSEGVKEAAQGKSDDIKAAGGRKAEGVQEASNGKPEGAKEAAEGKPEGAMEDVNPEESVPVRLESEPLEDPTFPKGAAALEDQKPTASKVKKCYHTCLCAACDAVVRLLSLGLISVSCWLLLVFNRWSMLV